MARTHGKKQSKFEKYLINSCLILSVFLAAYGLQFSANYISDEINPKSQRNLAKTIALIVPKDYQLGNTYYKPEQFLSENARLEHTYTVNKSKEDVINEFMNILLTSKYKPETRYNGSEIVTPNQSPYFKITVTDFGSTVVTVTVSKF